MQAKTHIAGGILAGELLLTAASLLAQSQNPASLQLFRELRYPGAVSSLILSGELLSAAAAGSILPDIDHSESRISYKNPITKILSVFFELVFRHRGPIHTPAVCALLSVFVYCSLTAASVPQSTVTSLTLGFAAGFLSHLFLDSLNRGGIMWLWPLKKRRVHFAEIKSRTAKETVLLWVLVGLAVLLAPASV